MNAAGGVPRAGRRVHAEDTRLRWWVRQVFASIDEEVGDLALHPDHRELLGAHLRVSEERAQAWSEMSAIEVPLLVHEAVTGDEGPALPVAAACTLLYLGTDLYDSMLDHELPASWRVRGPAEVSLTATALMATLPQLSLARLQREGTPPTKLWALARLFAETLQTMIAGEYEDVIFAGSADVSLEDCLRMVERKSGSAHALFARAGAVLATDDLPTTDAYAAFGQCFGTAKQLINDVWDIWGGGLSRDLLNGKRTLPVVHALSTLRGGQRERLGGLLEASRESAERHDEVRASLVAAGSVRYTAFVVWLYRQRARKHLATASPQGPAKEGLWSLLDRASLTPEHEPPTPSK